MHPPGKARVNFRTFLPGRVRFGGFRAVFWWRRLKKGRQLFWEKKCTPDKILAASMISVKICDKCSVSATRRHSPACVKRRYAVRFTRAWITRARSEHSHISIIPRFTTSLSASFSHTIVALRVISSLQNYTRFPTCRCSGWTLWELVLYIAPVAAAAAAAASRRCRYRCWRR